MSSVRVSPLSRLCVLFVRLFLFTVCVVTVSVSGQSTSSNYGTICEIDNCGSGWTSLPCRGTNVTYTDTNTCYAPNGNGYVTLTCSYNSTVKIATGVVALYGFRSPNTLLTCTNGNALGNITGYYSYDPHVMTYSECLTLNNPNQNNLTSYFRLTNACQSAYYPSGSGSSSTGGQSGQAFTSYSVSWLVMMIFMFATVSINNILY